MVGADKGMLITNEEVESYKSENVPKFRVHFHMQQKCLATYLWKPKCRTYL